MPDGRISQDATVAYKATLLLPAVDLDLATDAQNVNLPMSAVVSHAMQPVTDAVSVPAALALLGGMPIGGTIDTGPVTLASTSTAPVSSNVAQLEVWLNGHPTLTANHIYSAAIGAADAALVFGDGIRGIAEQPAASVNLTTSAITGYMLNKCAGGLAVESALALFGLAIGAADNSQTWGLSTITADTEGFTGVTAGVGKFLVGHEADLNVSSPNTQAIAVFTGGTAYTPAAFLTAFQAGGFWGGAGALWNNAFTSADGASATALYVGRAATSGPCNSQPIQLNYTDGSSVPHDVYFYGGVNSLTVDSDTHGTGSANLNLLHGNLLLPSDHGVLVNGKAVLSSNGTTTVFLASDAGLSDVIIGNTGVAISLANTTAPFTDNTHTIGKSSSRWSAVWAVNGTIQTSDPSLKTDIAPLPSTLALVAAINPVTFRWKSGGNAMEMVDTEEEYQLTQPATRDEPTVELRTGMAVRVTAPVVVQEPVFDQVPLLHPDGTPVTRTIPGAGSERMARTVPVTHAVPRMAKRTVQKAVPVEQPGKRLHWGFLAPDVKAAMDHIGMDFGGYVLAEDGTQNLRPDQLIPVLWKAVQELAADFAAYKVSHP
jgi:hypothetical protein